MSSNVYVNTETVSVVEIDKSTLEISIEKNLTEVVISQEQGPQGIPGPAGPAGESADAVSYRHIQSVASNSWEINHNLGWYPNITVVDSAGSVVEGEIDYVSENNLTLSFSSSFSGIAYLS